MSERSKSNWRPAIAFTLLLVLWGSLAFILVNRISDLKQQVTVLQDRVQEATARVQEAGEASEMALERATVAEQNAREAAAGRIQAEQATAEASQQTEQAERDAQQARQAASAANEQARQAREETAQIRQRRAEEIERLRKALGKIADTERTALGLVMTLGSDSIHFDFDRAELRADDRELLSRIAGVLLTAYGFRLHVYGHTDDVGTDQYNQALSERRAQSVRDYLVKAGVAADVIDTKGYGKTSPRVREATAAARAKNRRVEIAIIDSIIDYEGEVSQRVR